MTFIFVWGSQYLDDEDVIIMADDPYPGAIHRKADEGAAAALIVDWNIDRRSGSPRSGSIPRDPGKVQFADADRACHARGGQIPIRKVGRKHPPRSLHG